MSTRAGGQSVVDNYYSHTNRVHMPKFTSEPEGARGRDERRRRVQLLRLLIGVCRRIERMQETAEARLACRQVARSLAVVLGRERAGQAATEP